MRHAELLEGYITYVGLDRSPATQTMHREQLVQLFREWDDLETTEWTRTRFQAYYGKKRESLKPRSLCILLTATRGFLEWAREHADELGVTIEDFTKGIKRPRVHKGHPEIYTKDEILKLLNACHEAQRPMELVIGLAFYAGLRRKEIQDCDWSWICWERNQISVVGSKVAKTRVIPLNPKLRNILRAHWRNQKKGPVVQYPSFHSNVSRCLRFVCARAKVPYRSLHKIRHAFCSALFDGGVDAVRARDLMGHTSIETTNLYCQSAPDRLQAAVDVL